MTSIVLASASMVRRTMLEHAGLSVLVDPARVDEAEIKIASRQQGFTADAVAEMLADVKAQRISARHPGHLVVGADQMLDIDGQWLDKPKSLGEARDQLCRLRGKRHILISCVVVARDGVRLWHQLDRAQMTMRSFSDGFLERYISCMGDQVLHTVGGYQIEGIGAQLFARVQGDFWVIQGMPLLPLLDFLRQQKVLDT